MSMFTWEKVDPPPGVAVGPRQRLSWGKTAGLGAQHVVAMFGATFVFPLVMGLDPNLAIMFSGVCTIMFLLIVNNAVPSYLGTSASFVAGVAAIRGEGGDSSDVTGAILVAGLVLAAVGVFIHFAGSELIHKILPPAVTGAVVMLIGFNLAPVVAGIYWPEDQWVALITATFMVVAAVMFPGFWSRIAVFLALIFGYLISWLGDRLFGTINSVIAGGTEATDHDRIWNWQLVKDADWIGFPSGTLPDGVDVVHGPSFSLTFILLVLPGVIALIAENTGHVKAVAEMTGDVRREHRRHGRDPRLLHGGLLRRRGRRDPAGSLPQVRGDRRGHTRRGAGRDHARALRHDRPDRRQDLGRERGRLR